MSISARELEAIWPTGWTICSDGHAEANIAPGITASVSEIPDGYAAILEDSQWLEIASGSGFTPVLAILSLSAHVQTLTWTLTQLGERYEFLRRKYTMPSDDDCHWVVVTRGQFTVQLALLQKGRFYLAPGNRCGRDEDDDPLDDVTSWMPFPTREQMTPV